MTCILLLRHGHVAGIVPKRFRGRLDLPLSEEGRAQALQAATCIAQRYAPTAIYSSPLQRCVDSAAALATRLALSAPQLVPGLTDIDYGLWQGRLASAVASEDPARFAQWQDAPEAVRFPQGETLIGLNQRATAGLAALAARHSGQTIAVYSHDSVIRVVLLAAIGAPLSGYHRLRVDPCSLSELRVESGAVGEIVRINERTA